MSMNCLKMLVKFKTVTDIGLVLFFTCFLQVSSYEDPENCRPQQIHLSFGNTVKDITTVWSTKVNCVGTQVKHSDSPWKLAKSKPVPGVSRMFNSLSNSMGLQYLHRVKLMNLPSSPVYYYQPISGGISAGPFFFTVPEENMESAQFLFLGDLSSNSSAIEPLIQEAQTGKYNAILHAGNIAMNLSTRSGKNGDDFMRLMEPALKSTPYLTAPGRAEIEDGDFTHYRHRFSMLQSEWPMPLDNLWYSVDIGPVHFISFSTEVYHIQQKEYQDFLKSFLIKDIQLANRNRDKVPWVVAMGHEPLYCSYQDPNYDCHKTKSPVREKLDDVFTHFGVDIILVSMGSAYERSYPMFKGVRVSDNYTNPLGPVHVVTASATPWDGEYNFTHPAPERVAKRFENSSLPLSFGRLKVTNSSLAEYQQVAFGSGEILDSFTILQNKHGEFSQNRLDPAKSAQVDQIIIDSGGKPGVLNIEDTLKKTESDSKLANLLRGENRTHVIIGASVGAGILFLVIMLITVRKLRRRRRVSRRWEQMDINYGKKFYSKAPDRDDTDNDFEIDMTDGTEPTKKLLNDD